MFVKKWLRELLWVCMWMSLLAGFLWGGTKLYEALGGWAAGILVAVIAMGIQAVLLSVETEVEREVATWKDRYLDSAAAAQVDFNRRFFHAQGHPPQSEAFWTLMFTEFRRMIACNHQLREALGDHLHAELENVAAQAMARAEGDVAPTTLGE